MVLLAAIAQGQHQLSSQSQECAPSQMSRCTDPLKVVTDNKDLGFATSMDELKETCP